MNHTITNTYNSDDSLNTVSATDSGQTITNEYTCENDRLKSITHNGFAYTFEYDDLGNVDWVKVGATTLITNSYQARTGRLNSFIYDNGVVGRVTDVLLGKSTRYIFDFANRLVWVEESYWNSVAFSYDLNNNASTYIDTVNGTT